MKSNLHHYLSASLIIITALLSACTNAKSLENTETEHNLRQKIDSIIFNQKVDLGITMPMIQVSCIRSMPTRRSL